MPCISGQAGIAVDCPPPPTAPDTASTTSSIDWNGARPIPTATNPRNPSVNGPWAYITPFGIPVVPPV